MKTPKFYKLTLLILALLTINIYSQEDLPTKEKMELQTMEGTVTSLDSENRAITLMGPQGELTTITAGDDVERFDEIAVGDIVAFDLYTYMKAEFRTPTPEEIEEPLVILEEAARANNDDMPAGAVAAMMRAVVTIEVLNRIYMLATVKGPGGNYLTIQMEDKDLIQKLHIGQVLILTYAEAIAVSLEKVTK